LVCRLITHIQILHEILLYMPVIRNVAIVSKLDVSLTNVTFGTILLKVVP